VQSLLAGKAQDRIVTRYIQFFQDMAARVNEIRGSIPDNKYYASEEFQTLLALSYEQLLTTHDRAKLKMLAAALANSGAAACEGDPNKDRYLRAFRDIDVRDVHMLQEDRFRQYQEPIHAATYEIGDLPCLSRPVSMGLLNEQRYTGFGGGSVIGQDRAFWLSDFGRSFLNFISSESGRE
jgi:hypothetical protein